MVIPLSVPAFSLTAPALVDSGATDSFVDTAFAKKSGLPATRLKILRSLRLFDGGLAHSGPITHFVVFVEDPSTSETKLVQQVLKPNGYPYKPVSR